MSGVGGQNNNRRVHVGAFDSVRLGVVDMPGSGLLAWLFRSRMRGVSSPHLGGFVSSFSHLVLLDLKSEQL